MNSNRLRRSLYAAQRTPRSTSGWPILVETSAYWFANPSHEEHAVLVKLDRRAPTESGKGVPETAVPVSVIFAPVK
jgi:hypothetical protein